MAKWYYKSMGAEVGPINNKEMLEKVRKGEVTPETEVRKDDSKWYRASSVSGLFENAQKDAPKQVCPYCGQLVPNPPSKCESCGRWVTVSVESKKQEPKEKTPAKKYDIAEMLTEEEVSFDDGPANYALLLFAILFTCTLFLFIYMVISRNWQSLMITCLCVLFVLCVLSLLAGLWIRKRLSVSSGVSSRGP